MVDTGERNVIHLTKATFLIPCNLYSTVLLFLFIVLLGFFLSCVNSDELEIICNI